MIISRYFDHFWKMTMSLVPALMLMLFSGCAVGPDYQRPEATIIPEAYVGPGNDWKVATPLADFPRGNWWEIFGEAELNQLEADAMSANQDLKAAVSRFAQARASANVAESALYPRLGFSVQPVDQRDSKHRPVGGKPVVLLQGHAVDQPRPVQYVEYAVHHGRRHGDRGHRGLRIIGGQRPRRGSGRSGGCQITRNL